VKYTQTNDENKNEKREHTRIQNSQFLDVSFTNSTKSEIQNTIFWSKHHANGWQSCPDWHVKLPSVTRKGDDVIIPILVKITIKININKK
jgi:hypothetical protein